jgi:hypothetical protein
MSPEPAVVFQFVMILLFFISCCSGIERVTAGGMYFSNYVFRGLRRTGVTGIHFNFFDSISLTECNTGTTLKIAVWV